jgi:hypothetical protein
MVNLGENHNVLSALETDASSIDPSHKPFHIHHKGCMSFQWKITKKGCTAKNGNKIMLCMCCYCCVKDMHKPLGDPCKYCTKRTSARFNPKYHHHKLEWVQIETYKKRVKEMWEALQTELGSVDIMTCVFSCHDPSRANDRTIDPSSVNVVPTSLQESVELMMSHQGDYLMQR